MRQAHLYSMTRGNQGSRAALSLIFGFYPTGLMTMGRGRRSQILSPMPLHVRRTDMYERHVGCGWIEPRVREQATASIQLIYAQFMPQVTICVSTHAWPVSHLLSVCKQRVGLRECSRRRPPALTTRQSHTLTNAVSRPLSLPLLSW